MPKSCFSNHVLIAGSTLQAFNASPMQAIVFSSGHLSVKQMVKAGVWMDLIGVLLLMGLWALIGSVVF